MNRIVRQPAFSDLELAKIRTVLAQFKQRDSVLIHFALLTGLRISTLLSLVWRDVWSEDMPRAQIAITRAQLKGGQSRDRHRVTSRVVPMSESLRKMIAEYKFEVFGGGPPRLLEPLFRSREGKRLSRRQATHRLHEIMLAAGLHDRPGYGFHSARRWFARAAYYHNGSGCDIVMTAKLLGHASVETTLRYVGTEPSELAPAYDGVAERMLQASAEPAGVHRVTPVGSGMIYHETRNTRPTHDHRSRPIGDVQRGSAAAAGQA